MNRQHLDRLSQWRQGEFMDYTEWLDSWPWEWFGTFSLQDHDCLPTAQRMLRNWTRQLCTEEHIQVAYAYIYCEKQKHGHLHALLIGRNSDGDKTLADVSRSKWERRWPCLAGIKIPESNQAVVRYLCLHLFKFKCGNYPNIEFFNRKLLNQYQRPA
jgi:hypothetical protein